MPPGGWSRITRNLFDSVTSSDITQSSAVEAPYGIAATKYAGYANTLANVANTTGGKKGLKAAVTTAKGSMPLWGEQASNLRMYGGVYLGSLIANVTAPVYCGVVLLAQDANATPANARYVFAGLRIDTGGTNRQWILALMNDTGEITRYASLAAGSLGSGASIGRPFKVSLAADGHTITLRQNTDGAISTDVSADLASLGDWFGARFISTTSIASTTTVLLESLDIEKWDASLTPANDARDRVKLLPNFTPVLEFMPGSEVLLNGAGATPTYDPDDVIYGANSLVQASNPMTAQRYEVSFASPLDLSNKCLAMCCKPTAPDQLNYVTSTLSVAATAGDAVLTLASTAGMGVGSDGGYIDLGAGGVGVFFAHIVGNTLTGCTWTAGASGTFAIGTRAAQHNGNADPPATLAIEIAATSAERTAGNYIQLRALQVGYGGWIVPTWKPSGPAGVEGRTFGTATAAILTSIGYLRVTWACTTAIPYTSTVGAIYDGPQPPDTPSIKWDVIGTFDFTSKPTICFSFDDSHDSDYAVVAPELEKPRPGFPNGMRGTFYVIASNVDSNSFTTRDQYQRLSANGHEISVHVNQKVHHSSGDAGGDGPMNHYETVYHGSDADMAAELAYLSGLGIPGPLSYAFPYGNSHPVVIANAVARGIKGCRTLNGGGAVATITGSGASADCTGFDKSGLQTRFLTEPAGDLNRMPSIVMAKDLNTNDNLGHRIAERFILEAAQQGMKGIVSDHQMYPHGTPSAFSGSWSADQFGEVLDYVSDLKTGGNTSGRNGAANHFPDLVVQTVYEAVAGSAPQPAVTESMGLAA